MALPLYAATLFVSAFLLFLVQPMIGKMILPRLGGTPQVWNTCMVFFQSALLAGYAYTHTVSTKLSLRRQLLVHAALLFVPLLILLPWGPFNITESGWNFVPPPGANPIPYTLLLLTIVVGLPFFVVATSAPLLQRWFGYTGHSAAKDPYFLYGASNLGSMLALLAYPVFIEPLFRLQPANFANNGGMASFDLGSQNWVWTAGYLALIVLVLACAALVMKSPASVLIAGPTEASALIEPPPPGADMAAGEKPVPTPAAAAAPATQITAAPTPPPARQQTNIRRGSKRGGGRVHAQRPISPGRTITGPEPVAPAPPKPFEMTNWRRLRWVGLAAVPSSLMLGVTSYISVDISPMPLLWVVPLALYLLSFIFVFMRWPVVWSDVPHKIVLFAQPVALLLMVYLLISHGGFEPVKATLICLAGFFATALMCHGELAKDRPPTRYLTEFYLWMSVGGMLGGMFNGLLAPLLFVGVAEFPIAIVFAGLLRPRMVEEGWTEGVVRSLFPGLVEAINDKGDSIARARQQAAAGGVGAEAALSRRDLPPRGWLLGYVLDVVLPLVVMGIFWVFSIWISLGWLFTFFQNTLGFERNSAASGARVAYQALAMGIPLLLVFLFFGRPLRFGLGVAGLLLIGALQGTGERRSALTRNDGVVVGYIEGAVLNADRSYFGVLRVRESAYVAAKFILTDKTFAGLREDEVPDTVLEKIQELKGKEFPNVQAITLELSVRVPQQAMVSRILQRADTSKSGDKIEWYTYLMHGTTHHGLNFQAPTEVRRRATTYYHRFGPTGIIMSQIDWWPLAPDDYKKIGTAGGKWQPYWADARLPVSVIGSALAPLNGGLNPSLAVMPAVAGTWSEPPYATVGLGTGTMASYGRPFQHVVFYEIDNHVRRYSMPENNTEPFFNYVADARARGAKLEIIMGDARQSMKQEKPAAGSVYPLDQHFFPRRENYYRAIELDAFSSDAIPVHLITKEAIEMYFKKLIAPQDVEVVEKDDKGKDVTKKKHFAGGVLMVHTSNRHVDLVKPVTDVARALGEEWAVKAGRPASEWQKFIAWRVGKDHFQRGDDVLPARATDANLGRFSSEYVMIAKSEQDLPANSALDGEREAKLYWSTPRNPGNRVWTDDYSNLLSVFRW